MFGELVPGDPEGQEGELVMPAGGNVLPRAIVLSRAAIRLE